MPTFFFNDTAPTEIYTLSLHDALPISCRTFAPEGRRSRRPASSGLDKPRRRRRARSEEHTSELQSHSDLVCRLLLEKKKKKKNTTHSIRLNQKTHIRDSNRLGQRHTC